MASTVSADDVAPFGARSSAGTVMTKSESSTYMGPALAGLIGTYLGLTWGQRTSICTNREWITTANQPEWIRGGNWIQLYFALSSNNDYMHYHKDDGIQRPISIQLVSLSQGPLSSKYQW